jgi:hypothetical protein
MRAIDKLAVRSKFNLVIGVVAVGLLGCAGIGLYATSDLATTALEIQAWDVERLGLWSRIESSMLLLRRHEKDYLARSAERDEYYATGQSKYLDTPRSSGS